MTGIYRHIYWKVMSYLTPEYEWAVRLLDEDGDTVDVFHTDSAKQAIEWYTSEDGPVVLTLERKRYNVSGDLDWGAAEVTQVEGGYSLPERFTDIYGLGQVLTHKVPAKFHKALAKV